MNRVNQVLLAAHARGLVFVDMSRKVIRRITGRSANDIQADHDAAPVADRPSWLQALTLRQELDRMLPNGPNGWCKPSITAEYKKEMLLKEAQAYRTDTLITLAYQTSEDGRSLKCVGICSYGAADAADRPINDAALQNAVVAGRVLEIDLLCTKGHNGNVSSGTGTLLFQYCLEKQFIRKSLGQPKYQYAISALAGHGNGANFIRPLQNIATRLGFVHVASGHNVHGQEYIVAVRRNFLTLPNIENLSRVCALGPRTGIQYCK